MLLLKGTEFTDSVDTSKGTCKIMSQEKRKECEKYVHPDLGHKSVCVLIDKDQAHRMLQIAGARHL